MTTTLDATPTDPVPGATRPSKAKEQAGRWALVVGALGVVYGDIGTSPLYTVREILQGSNSFAVTQGNVYGAISLVFWTLMLVVSLKYVIIVMRASHHGDGGILALLSIITETLFRGPKRKAALIALGVFGAALFYGDVIITPAMSVLSAVEGLEVINESLSSLVIPVTLVILTALFAIQRFGSHAMGRLFGPVMVVWFITMGLLGLSHIVQAPGILRAINPLWGIDFLLDNGWSAFLALGAVVLCVTGAEALYADMGHFGHRAIRRAWFGLVYPGLALCYLGQGAMILGNPAAIESPFYNLVPAWGLIPLVVLSTLATVIASQSVISGAFSLSRQAVRQGLLPLLEIRHTSKEQEGQVYLPTINWLLYFAIVTTVLVFQSSGNLAEAYGLAVTGTFVVSSTLATVVFARRWKGSRWMVYVVGAFFVVMDLTFFAANLAKLFHGGWFPLAVGLVLFGTLMTWRKGQAVLRVKRQALEGSLQAFVDSINRGEIAPLRVPGTSVFLSAHDATTPLALRFNVKHNNVLHDHVVILNVVTDDRPVVPQSERLEVEDLCVPDNGIVLVRARYGYSEVPDVPAALRMAQHNGLAIDVDQASYFITRSTIQRAAHPSLSPLMRKLFINLNRNAGDPTNYFRLPEKRVVVMGSTISI